MAAKLNLEQIIVDATERYQSIIKECTHGKDYDTIVGLTCASLYGGEDTMPVEDNTPVLDTDLCFKYKDYQFELSSCNNITCKNQILDLTEKNFSQRFPNGVFTDRYVCWICGHKDYSGYTKEDSPEPEYWYPAIYLVGTAWSWGAASDLKPGLKVTLDILEAIDKFLETFKE